MNSREQTHIILLGEEFELDGIPEVVQANYGQRPNFSSPKIPSRSTPDLGGSRVGISKRSLRLSKYNKIRFNFNNDEIELY